MLKGKGLHALWVITTLTAVSMTGTAMADTSHKIRKGDTAYSIAKHYGVSVRSVLETNGLTEKSILPIGFTLVIPDAKPKRLDKTPTNPEPESKESTCLAESLPSRPVDLETRREAYLQSRAEDKEDGRSSAVVRTAFNYRGSRYRFGGTSRGGFDCSGFTRYVYAKYGIALPHSSSSQFSKGHPVSRNELRSGDLVFFATRSRGISHVGIYIGDNKFIHASNVRRGVTVDSLNSSYYAPRYRGARRVS